MALSLALMLAVVIGSGTAVTWWEDPTEYKVKAAFLYNYALFTTFPDKTFDGADDPLVVAVLGEDPFGKILDATIEGKRPNGRRLTVRRFPDLESLQKADPVHILYVCRSEDKRLDAIQSVLAKRPIFLVGEHAELTRSGGVCRLYINGQGMTRFEINLDEAGRRGLVLSSKLLALADIVRDAPRSNDADASSPADSARDAGDAAESER